MTMSTAISNSDENHPLFLVKFSEKMPGRFAENQQHSFKKSIPEMVLIWGNGEKGQEVKLRINNPTTVANSISAVD